jgi:hypothetical protein
MRTILLLVAATAACNAYDKDLGPSPYLCGDDEPRCPEGYACALDPATGADVCIAADDSVGDVDCNDDSQYEPNNMLTEAKSTPVDTMKSYTIDNLAVCPSGDKDLFTITLAGSNENVELIFVYEAGGAVLKGQLLNSGGIPVATATQVEGMTNTLRSYSQNLPSGTYYVQGSTASNVSNYKVTINVTTN